MEFLSQTYVALRGPTGAPQTAAETIGKLSDRLSPSTLLADRRAAVLALKGLSRDHKQDVGDRALLGLLDVLENDAELDADIGKATLETLNLLCDTTSPEPTQTNDPLSPPRLMMSSRELGFKHTDKVLATEKALNMLFVLLGGNNFYTRFAAIQYLTTLLDNRRQVVQAYFMKAPAGSSSIIAILEDKREIIRNEGVSMVQSLISQSPDIQKILAFEGAFEKLFNTITAEGGIEGGLVVQEALTCIDGLLRFNSSNQSYFRETPFPPVLCSLLAFPRQLQIHEPAPQEFALQFWDQQKLANATIVVAIMGMLIGSKGGSASETHIFVRCFVEIALATNAPTALKAQTLRLLPTNLNFPLSEITLTPYMPVPESNGEEWDRLEPASALDALVELVLHGEYNGLYSAKRIKDGLELRGIAVAVFENFARKEEIRQAIVGGMLPAGVDSQTYHITPLLHALVVSPTSASSIDIASLTSTHFATLLFSHLLRSSPKAKSLAKEITPPPIVPPGSADNFFVPADGAPPSSSQQPQQHRVDEDEDPPQPLLQLLNENLSLAFLSRSRPDTSEREAREWDRLIVGYLCLLSQWLWEEPEAVREFLDAGGLGTLVEPINQSSEVDPIVPGLCAFLLGVCYEFNRKPGEIARSTIYPILNRLGIDTLVGRMSRVREDERFKEISPETIVLPYPTPAHLHPGVKPEVEGESEIWFDWAFVDFWKSNYYTVQRGFSMEPDAQSSSSSGQQAETQMLVASLREVIKAQAEEIEQLKIKLKESSTSGSVEKVKLEKQVEKLETQLKVVEENEKNSGSAISAEKATLEKQIDTLKAELNAAEEKRKEVEKEQEDLLVLLDEVSGKRKRDKEKMRAKGIEVSEDEAEEDDDEDEDEDEDDEEEEE